MGIRWKGLAFNLFVPVATGALVALLIRKNVDVYDTLVKPPLAPPSAAFPIAWTVLYLLMGISCYLVYASDADDKLPAYVIYGAQLVFNFFWPILFFNTQSFLLSFIWLLALLFLIISMMLRFSRCSRAAANLQIPYLLWSCYAAYLNLGIFVLNR